MKTVVKYAYMPGTGGTGGGTGGGTDPEKGNDSPKM